MKKGEIVFFGAATLFFGFMLIQATGLVGQGRAGEIGSGLWPLLALGASAVLSVVLLVASIRKSRRAEPAAAAPTSATLAESRDRKSVVWERV